MVKMMVVVVVRRDRLRLRLMVMVMVMRMGRPYDVLVIGEGFLILVFLARDRAILPLVIF